MFKFKPNTRLSQMYSVRRPVFETYKYDRRERKFDSNTLTSKRVENFGVEDSGQCLLQLDPCLFTCFILAKREERFLYCVPGTFVKHKIKQMHYRNGILNFWYH